MVKVNLKQKRERLLPKEDPEEKEVPDQKGQRGVITDGDPN